MDSAQAQLGDSLDQGPESGTAQNVVEEDHAALEIVDLAGLLIPSCTRASDDGCYMIKHLQSPASRQRRNGFCPAMEDGGERMAFFLRGRFAEMALQATF